MKHIGSGLIGQTIKASAIVVALVMSTSLGGRPVLRLCPINPATNSSEIDETIQRLGRISAEVGARGVVYD